MARPQKAGLDYFPLDVDIANDEKVEYIEAKHGVAGFGIFIHLLMMIYRNGYYVEWGERQLYVFSKRVNVDIKVTSDVLNDCIYSELFDRNLYETYGILTSHGIQTRYLQACERRKSIFIVKEFLLATPDRKTLDKIIYQKPPKFDKCTQKLVSSGVNVDINSAQGSTASAENPQSKVKNNNVVVVTRARARDIEEGNTSEVFTAFSNNIHPLTGEIEADTLGDLLDHYGKEWVLEAIKEAAKNHGTSVKYIEAILQAWERNGFKAPKKGRGNRNGRYIQGNSGADREETEGLRKLKEDMAYADAHTVHPWDVQPDRRGDGEEPGKDSGGGGRAGAM